MKFVKSDDLKLGMRLAKPIYNRDGVMLYERNSKLTRRQYPEFRINRGVHSGAGRACSANVTGRHRI